MACMARGIILQSCTLEKEISLSKLSDMNRKSHEQQMNLCIVHHQMHKSAIRVIFPLTE